MKSGLLSAGFMVSAVLLASAAGAAEKTNGRTQAPTPATVALVTKLVSERSSGYDANVKVYPTADREVVFVTFDTEVLPQRGGHIALVETRGGQVTRFTDLTHSHPKALTSRTASAGDDAQSQARALLTASVGE